MFDTITIAYSDGYEAQARYWPPAGAARGAVLYLHGIQSHGGWFEGSAGCLARGGFHVFLPDRRGSGLNHQERGHARSAGRLLQDVLEATAWLKGRTGLPGISLVGVSWGGKLAMVAALRQAEDIRRLVLVAPGLFPRVDLPVRQKIAVAAAALLRPMRRFAIPLNEPDLFTDNPARQAYIRDDPLRLRQVTARFLAASRMLDVQVAREAGQRDWPMPVTFLLAGKERIVDNERTRRLARGLRCRHLRVVEHPGASHTLEFEPDPQRYYEDLAAAVAQDEPPGSKRAEEQQRQLNRQDAKDAK